VPASLTTTHQGSRDVHCCRFDAPSRTTGVPPNPIDPACARRDYGACMPDLRPRDRLSSKDPGGGLAGRDCPARCMRTLPDRCHGRAVRGMTVHWGRLCGLPGRPARNMVRRNPGLRSGQLLRGWPAREGAGSQIGHCGVPGEQVRIRKPTGPAWARVLPDRVGQSWFSALRMPACACRPSRSKAGLRSGARRRDGPLKVNSAV
jgi:hypothetical protein